MTQEDHTDTEKNDPAPGSIGVWTVGNARFLYRIGTTDEFVLAAEYGLARYFPSDYEPENGVTILDVGAHIGSFAVLAAQRVPNGVVHAIEPASENFDLLRKNLQNNNIRNVVAHRLALGARNGTVRLNHGPGSVGHSLYLNPGWANVTPEPRSVHAEPLAPYEDVRSRLFADFLTDNAIEDVAFMKMNIEGAEYVVLLGAPEDVLQRIHLMQVELHPEDEGLCDRLLERLSKSGFSTTVVWSSDPTVKGWLTAARG